MSAERTNLSFPSRGRALRASVLSAVLVVGFGGGLVAGRLGARAVPDEPLKEPPRLAAIRTYDHWAAKNCPAPGHPEANIC